MTVHRRSPPHMASPPKNGGEEARVRNWTSSPRPPAAASDRGLKAGCGSNFELNGHIAAANFEWHGFGTVHQGRRLGGFTRRVGPAAADRQNSVAGPQAGLGCRTLLPHASDGHSARRLIAIL